MVDRHLTASLKGCPLVVAGVAAELAAYRAISENPNLVVAAPASPEHLSWNELTEPCVEALLESQRSEAERVR